MKERPIYKGAHVNLSGNALSVGDLAPEVALVKGDLSSVNIGGSRKNAQLIICILSADTPVCATELKTFNAKCAAIEGVDAIAVSMDLPFAQNRFVSNEGIDRLILASDFRDRAFGRGYGALIADGALASLLARAVFVVAPNGRIVYKEIVKDISDEPNYDAALSAVKEAVKPLANDENAA